MLRTSWCIHLPQALAHVPSSRWAGYTYYCLSLALNKIVVDIRCLSLHLTLTLRRCYVLLLVSYILTLLLRTFIIVICWRCYTLPTNFNSASSCDINICSELTLSLICCIDCFDTLHNVYFYNPISWRESQSFRSPN